MDPLYQFLRKGKKFQWKPDHTETVKELKEVLHGGESLKKWHYDRPIRVTVDTSPTEIGWVVNQEDAKGDRYAIRFGAKVLNDRQHKYAHVKREL